MREFSQIKKEEVLCFLSGCFGLSYLYLVPFCLILAWLLGVAGWVYFPISLVIKLKDSLFILARRRICWSISSAGDSDWDQITNWPVLTIKSWVKHEQDISGSKTSNVKRCYFQLPDIIFNINKYDMMVPINIKSLFNSPQEESSRKMVIYILLSLKIFLQSSYYLTYQ